MKVKHVQNVLPKLEMSKNIGFAGRILNFMKQTFRISPKESYLIGQDHLGNKYFEKQAGFFTVQLYPILIVFL